MSSHHEKMLREAVQLAQENRERGGRPFGAVLAMDNEVIAVGVNNIHLVQLLIDATQVNLECNPRRQMLKSPYQSDWYGLFSWCLERLTTHGNLCGNFFKRFPFCLDTHRNDDQGRCSE